MEIPKSGLLPGWKLETDDTRAAEHAVRLGVFDQLQTAITAGNTQALIIVPDGPELRLIAMFCGCDRRGDDGFVVTSAPKSWVNFVRLNLLALRMGGTGHDHR
jgi:hypothetical protein